MATFSANITLAQAQSIAIGRAIAKEIDITLTPKWSWDATTGVLPPSSTFARADTVTLATYYDSNGILQYSPPNTARFTYDPTTHLNQGYLQEPSAINMVTNSYDFTGWTTTNSVLNNGAVTSPDNGTTAAATITEDTNTGAHAVAANTNDLTFTSGSKYGFSFFTENISGARYLQVSIGLLAAFNFRPSDGTFGAASVGGSGGTFSGLTATALPNGWYRVSGTWTASSSTTTNMRAALADTDTATLQPSYTGDGTSSVALWGLQFELLSNYGPTSYMRTVGGAVAARTRGQDKLTLPVAAIKYDPGQGGCVVITATRVPPTTSIGDIIWSIGPNNAFNTVQLFGQNGTLNAHAFIMNTASTQFNITTSAVTGRFRSAAGWSRDTARVAINGASRAFASGAYTLPTGATTFSIGWNFQSGASLHGTIENVAYYAGMPIDPVLIALSSLTAPTSNSAVTLRRSVVRNAFQLSLAFSLSLVRRPGRIIKPLSAQAISINRAMTHSISIASGEALSAVRRVVHAIGLSPMGSTVSLVRTALKSISAPITQLVTLSRAIGKAVLLSTPNSLVIRRNISKTVQLAALTSVTTLKRMAGHLISMTLDTTDTLSRTVLHTVSLVNAELVSMQRALSKFVNLATAQLITAKRGIGHAIPLMLTTSVISLQKTVLHTISMINDDAFQLIRSIGKNVRTTTGSTVSLSRAVAKNVTTVTSSVISMRRFIGHAVLLGTNSLITLPRRTSHAIGMTSPQSVSAVKLFYRSFTMAMGNVASVIGQLFTHPAIDRKYIIKAIKRLRLATEARGRTTVATIRLRLAEWSGR